MINVRILILIILMSLSSFGQQPKNSETRKFIDSIQFTQINRDWNEKAEFRSGVDEVVSFFPVEAIDLKTNARIKALQMDMKVNSSDGLYFKTSWIDLDEIVEFTSFIEKYVVPNLKDKMEHKQSTTFVYNSKEMQFTFYIGKLNKRISIYLKDSGVTDYKHYFWTETQVGKIPDLLEMLKKLR